MNPGPVVIVRDNQITDSPNHLLRQFRADAATAIREARLDADTAATIWALILAAEGWATVAEWIRVRLNR